MIGNVWEWTAEWYASPIDADAVNVVTFPPDAGIGRLGERNPVDSWPGADLYRDDGTWNVAGRVAAAGTVRTLGLPAAALRGGSYLSSIRAGVFALNLGGGPSLSQNDIGFRCVIPR